MLNLLDPVHKLDARLPKGKTEERQKESEGRGREEKMRGVGREGGTCQGWHQKLYFVPSYRLPAMQAKIAADQAYMSKWGRG